MATRLTIDPATELLMDQLMTTGRFADRTAILQHGIRLVHDEERAATAPLDAATRAMLEQRIAEADAHPERLMPAEMVFAEMERGCLDEIERRRTASQ